MTSSIMVCLGGLCIEVFGSKMSFLHVLDCHNSPRRAITRHGEQEVRTGGSARPLLASHTISLAMASRQWGRLLVLLVMAGMGVSRAVFLEQILNGNPSIQDTKA